MFRFYKVITLPVLILCFLNGGIQKPSREKPTHHLFAKTNPEEVFKPFVICNAPTNEATAVALKNGEYRIFYINRPGSADKLMSVSSGDGKEWGIPEKEFDLPGVAYYANQVLEDKEGTMHCMFHLKDEGDYGYRGRHYDLWYCRKKSGTTGWTKPVKIFNGYVGSFRNFMQLECGRVLLAFGKAVPKKEERPQDNNIDYGWNEVISLYSDDNGENWHSSTDALRIAIDSRKATRYGAIEPDVIQLKDGTLWMLIRTNKGVLYQSFSSDSGGTWSSPEPTQFISSDSPADLLRLEDGRIVIFFNMNQRWDDPNTYAFGGREVLHAAISSDEGKTWKGFKEVLWAKEEKGKAKGDRGTAYASAVETKEGKVLFVSGQGESGYIAMFDPNWLEQDFVGEDSRINPNEWTLYGLTDVVSKEYLESENRIKFFCDTICGNSPVNDVVWNFSALQDGELNMDIEFIDPCPYLRLSFSDHFSISADSLAARHSVFNFILENKYKKGAKIPIRVRWNSKEKNAELYVFNQKQSSAEFGRLPVFGINYLRIGIPANESTRKPGFIVGSVAVINHQKN